MEKKRLLYDIFETIGDGIFIVNFSKIGGKNQLFLLIYKVFIKKNWKDWNIF